MLNLTAKELKEKLGKIHKNTYNEYNYEYNEWAKKQINEIFKLDDVFIELIDNYFTDDNVLNKMANSNDTFLELEIENSKLKELIIYYLMILFKIQWNEDADFTFEKWPINCDILDYLNDETKSKFIIEDRDEEQTEIKYRPLIFSLNENEILDYFTASYKYILTKDDLFYKSKFWKFKSDLEEKGYKLEINKKTDTLYVLILNWGEHQLNEDKTLFNDEQTLLINEGVDPTLALL